MSQATILNVRNKKIGHGQPLFFAVEEGQANLGNFDVALRMIDIATEAGADAIEFQFAIADDFYVKNHPAHKRYKEREFTPLQLKTLFERGIDNGIIVYAAPLSHNLVPILADVGCELYNVNSSDILNHQMIQAVARTEKPFFISTAMSSLEDIESAYLIAQECSQEFGLLHGQHVMATSDGTGVPESHTQLGVIRALQEKFALPVGFIDHTSNPAMTSIALTAGAHMVTKHFCESRANRGPDWHICLEPQELKQSIALLRSIEHSLAQSRKTLIEGEDKDQLAMRRSIVATRVIKSSEVLTELDIAFKRPGTGLHVQHASSLIGYRASRDLQIDEPILIEDVVR
jgi:sialic acid synthase SpsE